MSEPGDYSVIVAHFVGACCVLGALVLVEVVGAFIGWVLTRKERTDER